MDRTCKMCGRVFAIPKPAGRPTTACSEECRLELRRKRASLREKTRVRGLFACRDCGRAFPHRQSTAPARCRECRQRLSELGRQVRAMHSQFARTFICKQCGELSEDSRRRTYCSDACSVKANIGKVMGLYRAAYEAVDVPKAMMWRFQLVAYLADRDGTRCEICSGHIDTTLPSGPRGNEMGPSVDHVIPRSQGGSDDLANLRLTHWKCNRERRAVGGGEQLRLVG